MSVSSGGSSNSLLLQRESSSSSLHGNGNGNASGSRPTSSRLLPSRRTADSRSLGSFGSRRSAESDEALRDAFDMQLDNYERTRAESDRRVQGMQNELLTMKKNLDQFEVRTGGVRDRISYLDRLVKEQRESWKVLVEEEEQIKLRFLAKEKSIRQTSRG